MSSSRHRYRPELTVAPEPDEPPDYSHAQPRGTVLLFKVLTVAVVLLLVIAGWLLFTTYRLQQGQSETTAYIEGRGEARDAENQRLQQDISDAVCNVMDSLPAGAVFDPTRELYGCGPGIPVEQLDAETAQNLADIIGQGQAAPAATEPPSGSTEAAPTPAGPTLPQGAVVTPSVPSPSSEPQLLPTSPAPAQAAPQPPPITPAAPTTPAPAVDLSPVTDAVCGLLRICA